MKNINNNFIKTLSSSEYKKDNLFINFKNKNFYLRF